MPEKRESGRRKTKTKEQLEAYRLKRDFGRTPEPRAKSKRAAASDQRAFVIHRHEASRLHYDLRLEMEGVLTSWAVPKVFSFDPKEKRLAVRTEDHPLEYLDFHGVIPPGQYGAGTMTIWDRGWYELLGPEEDGPASLAAGKLELRLYGGRLRGDWHMVQLKGQKDWLLFKSRDRYSRGKDDPVIALDLSTRRRRGFPRRSPPMRGTQREPFYDPDWLYELRLTGQRVRAEKKGAAVKIKTPDGCDLTRKLSGVASSLVDLRAERALLDGVLVCLDDAGRPSKDLLARVFTGDESRPVQLYVFDLLYYEEWPLLDFPLSERKAALQSVLNPSESVFYVEHERGRARELVETVRDTGLPGVIAKHAHSTYQSGVSDDWAEFPVRRGAVHSTDIFTALREARRKRGGERSKVKFTNRQKVLWPHDGFTKGDLIDYYEQVADALVPYLMDRPLSLNRFPDGIESESFYQKNIPDSVPSWVPTVDVASSNDEGRIRFVVCNDRDTLLFLANLASIDLHPWLSRTGSLASPDFAVLDLDPLAASFAHVCTIARALGKLLRGIGLRPYVKTSGAKGIHVYVPLRGGYTYDQSRMFCEGVARVVASRHRDIATVQRSKGHRAGKVYIDYLQNRRGQTVVAPYVVRPVRGATVSAPLDWDEVNSDLHPGLFTIHTMPGRLAQRGDLFSLALTDRQDLSAAIDRLREMVASGG